MSSQSTEYHCACGSIANTSIILSRPLQYWIEKVYAKMWKSKTLTPSKYSYSVMLHVCNGILRFIESKPDLIQMYARKNANPDSMAEYSIWHDHLIEISHSEWRNATMYWINAVPHGSGTTFQSPYRDIDTPANWYVCSRYSNQVPGDRYEVYNDMIVFTMDSIREMIEDDSMSRFIGSIGNMSIS